MDIKYIHENDIHEKYILEQLDEKEKQAYEAFLETNPQAQKELQDTRRLISGIKDAGAGAMRREIEEQVAVLRNPKTDWSIMYKAAAVLFILVLLPAIFYYQDRFVEQPEITEQTISSQYESETQDEQPGDQTPPENEPVPAEIKDQALEDATNEAPAKARQSMPTTKAPAATDAPVAKKGEDNMQQILDKIAVDDLNITASGAGAGNRNTDLQPNQSKGQMESQSIQLDTKRAATLQKSNRIYSIPTKSDMTDVARSEAPSGIIGMDYIPKIRSFIFTHNQDSLKINMNRTSMRDAFPDFLKMSYTEDSTGMMEVNIYVSDQLHIFEKNEINVNWESSTLLTIRFADKAAYSIKLQQGQKTATRLK